MAISDDLAYELNVNAEKVVVRSLESVSRVYLRFANQTYRPVDVSWRDFEGKRQHYMRLKPGESRDITTYLTHPWEFVDAATRESYMINNRPIFRAPVSLGGQLYRTQWNITVGVRTLRQTALICVATLVGSAEFVPELGLPRSLEEELASLITDLNTPQSLAE